MIKAEYEEVFKPTWIKNEILDQTDELVLWMRIIPWSKIISTLEAFYTQKKVVRELP